jgi:dipeptidyl aminopeptidase/acylaminoacyl peptidase
VPIGHSQKILAEMKSKNVDSELLVIEGAAHGFGGEDGKRASDALVGWFEKHLLQD